MPKQFHLNSNTIGFHQQTLKLEQRTKYKIVQCESTAKEVLFERSDHRISSRNTLFLWRREKSIQQQYQKKFLSDQIKAALLIQILKIMKFLARSLTCQCKASLTAKVLFYMHTCIYYICLFLLFFMYLNFVYGCSGIHSLFVYG